MDIYILEIRRIQIYSPFIYTPGKISPFMRGNIINPCYFCAGIKVRIDGQTDPTRNITREPLLSNIHVCI